MDEKDQEIVRLLQDGFPLDPEPFKVIGDKLWIDEMAVISRLARLHQKGVIRHLGVFLDSSKLGYTGVLAAVQVAAADLDRVCTALAAMDGVTHNYLRDGEPNLWFTLITRTPEERQRLIEQVSQAANGARVMLFPSKRLFKVRTDLD
ncbi:MAG TPA: Lrp/AsnC family transcriptional regulator [Candidatus Ozemobacteraceae bacterium]|nr:Lrp/AsnC family transcriptional regulator [Candidatus Ozemobacteraceae bacterium]